VGNAQMVTGVPLPCLYSMVGICDGGIIIDGDRRGNGELAGYQGGVGQPGAEPAF